METASKASEEPEVVLEALRTRGWCFGDLQQVKATITIHYVLAIDATKVVDSVESELLNLDLRLIGGKSLPDPSRLRKSSYLQGPKVLQISSVRDISSSTVDEFSRSSGDRRLLRLGLTDGNSDITAIEYSHIPLTPDNVVPGTKVRLEDKTVIRGGIVCLNSGVLTILGGVVQSLYDEWQMNKKYSGFSRSSLRKVEESEADRPPQFVKLHVGSPSGPAGYGDSNFRTLSLLLWLAKLGWGQLVASNTLVRNQKAWM
ncbi:uncharacterized protein LOC129300503 [Prosopis cineraria]|uniref:uncharacterized protein LOC129300503 n=1 Tax=Prosopis cineraria TaxID=364024 RepID=UPI00240F5BE5|nr:uncharacterized protein LOC129300503 [Prosopis cineraria]XP_054795048.1 uncharacterized protein LOC129300503 [Prosopis cineraria]